MGRGYWSLVQGAMRMCLTNERDRSVMDWLHATDDIAAQTSME